MRLLNVIFLLLIAAVVAWLGHVYIQNMPVFRTTVTLWQGLQISVGLLVLVVFLAGFVLNVLYSGIMEVRSMVRNANASAATRAGRRLSARMQDARELSAHGLYRDAKEILANILRERPDYLPAGLLLAEVLGKLGETELALKQLEALNRAQPELVELRYLMAEAQVNLRNRDAAISLLMQVAGEHPKQALRALRRLRALCVEAGRWEEALDMQKRLSSRFASELNQAERAMSAALSYQVGMLRVEADQFREASQIFQQIVKDDPSFVAAYLSLGRCMALQDQEAQGVEIWLEGFRATGEGALLQELEDFFIQSGKPEEGLAVLQRVAATSEHGTTAKFFLGKFYYRLEILDEALELFQEVRSQVVYSPILFFYMAKIHARRGRLEQALNEYRQLLRNLGVLKLRFECQACGHKTQDYQERCESCGGWNSLHFLFKENDLSELNMRPETGSWMSLA